MERRPESSQRSAGRGAMPVGAARAPVGRACAAVIALGAAGACDDAVPGPQELLPRDVCAIAVVASDFGSTSVSLLAADGRPCALDVVHSGSRPPGLLTALSGDVVLPTEPPAAAGSDPRLVLVDRYPNGIVTVLDPEREDVAVEAQYAVAPGFSGNPQDVLFVDARTAMVSRLEPNPHATDDPIDFDDGSDLLVIDPVDGHPVGRVDLGAAADAGFAPMPGRLAAVGGLVWAGLAHLSAPHFDAAGPGRVAAVDPEARALVEVVALDGLANCGQLAPAPSGVWVDCSGKFASGAEAQLAHSGLAYVDAASREVAWVGRADALTAAPFGLAIAAVDDARVFAVALGDKVAARGDRLVVIDRRSSQVTTVLTTPEPFELAWVLPSPAVGVALVAVADGEDPRIERLALDDFHALAPITGSTATGLPPRQLAFFRAPR